MPEKKTILIVGYDEDYRLKLQHILQADGYQVITAADGDAGLKKATQVQPKVIISEWLMSGLDGIALCYNIKHDPTLAYVYFILLTTDNPLEDKLLGLAAGNNDYLAKSCSPDELRIRVKVGLRVNRLEQELANKNKQLEVVINAQQWEFTIASKVQQAILKLEEPKQSGLKFASSYQPCATLNGDMFDAMALPDGRIGALIADVSGHGASASLITILFRTLFRSKVFDISTTAEVFKQVNQSLLASLEDLSSFVTAAFTIFDPKTKVLTYSTPGHPPLLLLRKDGSIETLEAKGVMLGMFEDYWCDQAAIQLCSGDRIFYYTDGILEQKDHTGQQFGSQRIIDTLEQLRQASLEQLLAGILEAVSRYAQGTRVTDDYSMMVVEVE